jgi:hypothetical protein
MEKSQATNGRQTESEENTNIQVQPKKKMKRRIPTVKVERSAYSSKGWNRPCMS